MSAADSFLQEIIAAPDDDGPRLVYADWLEERGDPRAEFIRVQCEEARLGDSDRREELRRRVRQLLRKHATGWTAELGAKGAEIRGPDYHRGFVESAKMSIRFCLKSGAELMAKTPIRRVTLTSGGKLLPKLAQAQHLLGLQELCFVEHRFPESDAAEFVQSPYLANLQTFELHRSHFDSGHFASALASSSFTKLTALNLGLAQSVDPNWAEPLLNAPWLRTIESLHLGRLNDEMVRRFASSPLLGNLKNWYMTNIGLSLSTETGRTLAASPLTTHLERLSLCFCNMTIEGLRALAAANWSALQTLDITGAKLGPAGIAALVSGNWPALKRLDLCGTEMGSEGLAALLHRPWLKNLELLNLVGNDLTKQDLLTLIASPNWSHRTKICLSANSIDRMEAEEILVKLDPKSSLSAELRRVVRICN